MMEPSLRLSGYSDSASYGGPGAIKFSWENTVGEEAERHVGTGITKHLCIGFMW
ncbi:MAG: hypothetical protein ACHQVS_02345 [Candidatus Babeliales bacterium]